MLERKGEKAADEAPNMDHANKMHVTGFLLRRQQHFSVFFLHSVAKRTYL